MNKVEKLIVSSLLRDMEKVIRRGSCSTKDHTMQGIEFLEEEEIKIEDKEEILKMVKNQHGDPLKFQDLAEDDLSYILYESDNIAAGIDRRKLEAGRYGEEMLALRSVFHVLNREKAASNEVHFIAPRPATEEDILLPTTDKAREVTVTGEYYRIQAEYIRTYLSKTPLNAQTIHSLLGLLEGTTSCIPSDSYVDQPDIPLYDHSKMTAAVAANYCLYLEEKHQSNYKCRCFTDPQELRDEKTMLFVTGEFSGVQNFIYSIASANAMKSLRGRSFYLELLTEHVIDEILENSGVCRTNLIYSGASSFYMLLPHTQDTLKVLEKVQEKTNDFLLEKYSVEMYFAVTHTPCSANDLANDLRESQKKVNTLGDLFRQNALQISKLKKQRYSLDQLKQLFDPDSSINKIENHARECSICHASKQLKTYPHLDGKEICPNCYGFIQLGKQLAKYALGESGGQTDYYFVQTSLFDEENLHFSVPSLEEEEKNIYLLQKDQTKKFLQEGQKGRVYSVNRKTMGPEVTGNLWVGDYNTPPEERSGGLIEFDELAKRCQGISRLAVLRADIDDLGVTFAYGFQDRTSKENRYKDISLSRIATFSRLLTEFFKKNINGIARRSYAIEGYSWFNILSEKTEPQELVVVYSGGDDVFVIGTWSAVIEFAVDLRQIFKRYTANRLDFSAGIGFFKNGYPVSQMAIKAGELESAAKELPGKGAVALFGLDPLKKENHIYKWDEFIHQVVGEKYSNLKSWFSLKGEQEKEEEGKLPCSTAFLYRLMELARINLGEEKKKVDFARLVYSLSRMSYTSGQEAVYMAMRSQIINWFQDPKDLHQLLTALQILIYEIRE